jgi:nucleoside-diphosphate-sugar epimerase
MRVLVTGSSGQIGSNLALECMRRGHEVTGIDRRPNPWTGSFPTLLHDLGKPFEPPRARPDVVVHLAAHAKVHELVLEPARALENVTMTHHVLEYCRILRVPLVLGSSREVYGDDPRESTRESDARLDRAASPYAAAKLAAEAMTYSYARCYGLRYLVFRLSNVYGRYDNDLARMERVVPLFIERLRARRSVTVFGADKVLDFTHVDDCVSGLAAGIERLCAERLSRETFNIACGEGHTLVELALAIGGALGTEPEIEVRPARPGEIVRYVANIDKARALLDFRPRFPLREGLARALAWHREWRDLGQPASERSE